MQECPRYSNNSFYILAGMSELGCFSKVHLMASMPDCTFSLVLCFKMEVPTKQFSMLNETAELECAFYAVTWLRLGDGENQLACKLLSRSQLCMANDNDIKNTIAKTKRNSAEMSVEHFKLYQQATGFNFEPFGLLFCAELEHNIFPASQYVHDWMHTLVANGVFHTVFTAWLEAANGHLDIYKELEKYFDLWVHPVSRKLQHLFPPKRKSSEALSLAPILCFYIQKTFLPANVLPAECNVPGQILDNFAARYMFFVFADILELSFSL